MHDFGYNLTYEVAENHENTQFHVLPIQGYRVIKKCEPFRYYEDFENMDMKRLKANHVTPPSRALGFMAVIQLFSSLVCNKIKISASVFVKFCGFGNYAITVILYMCIYNE